MRVDGGDVAVIEGNGEKGHVRRGDAPVREDHLARGAEPDGVADAAHRGGPSSRIGNAHRCLLRSFFLLRRRFVRHANVNA